MSRLRSGHLNFSQGKEKKLHARETCKWRIIIDESIGSSLQTQICRRWSSSLFLQCMCSVLTSAPSYWTVWSCFEHLVFLQKKLYSLFSLSPLSPPPPPSGIKWIIFLSTAAWWCWHCSRHFIAIVTAPQPKSKSNNRPLVEHYHKNWNYYAISPILALLFFPVFRARLTIK